MRKTGKQTKEFKMRKKFFFKVQLERKKKEN